MKIKIFHVHLSRTTSNLERLQNVIEFKMKMPNFQLQKEILPLVRFAPFLQNICDCDCKFMYSCFEKVCIKLMLNILIYNWIKVKLFMESNRLCSQPIHKKVKTTHFFIFFGDCRIDLVVSCELWFDLSNLYLVLDLHVTEVTWIDIPYQEKSESKDSPLALY